MKSTVEVLERMDQIVVHVHQQHGPDDHVDTLVLDAPTALILCAQLLKTLKNRGKPQAAAPLRWWKVSARASERRGPRDAYAQGRTGAEAHRASVLGHLHEAEVTWAMLAEDFVPPKEVKR